MGPERTQLLEEIEVDEAAHCQGTTVHSVGFVHQKIHVFYASSLSCVPCATAIFKRCRTNGIGDKHGLVSSLWDHLVAMESHSGKCWHSSTRDDVPIQVVHDPLGKPHLLLGGHRGPAISFSHYGEKVWAAVCGDDSDIGIDMAGDDEFRGEYPFHRVFHAQELQHASMLTGGDVAKASALLWSVKEAVVKALGCAFHLVDPLQLTVYPSAGEANGWHTFQVGLSGKALVRFPIVAGRSIWVRSFPQCKMCLSIALLNQRPTGP